VSSDKEKKLVVVTKKASLML